MADSGDVAEYEQLEQHREYLTFLARKNLDRQLQAKVDLSGVVQQTLFNAHQDVKGKVFKDSSARLAWLRRILANNLVDAIRKVTSNKHDIFREQSLSNLLDESSVRLENLLAADLPTPSEPLRNRERALQMSVALSRLNPAMRQAIILKYWDNKSLIEISEEMERTPAAIAGLLKRGLKKLREEFSRKDGDAPEIRAQ